MFVSGTSLLHQILNFGDKPWQEILVISNLPSQILDYIQTIILLSVIKVIKLWNRISFSLTEIRTKIEHILTYLISRPNKNLPWFPNQFFQYFCYFDLLYISHRSWLVLFVISTQLKSEYFECNCVFPKADFFWKASRCIVTVSVEVFLKEKKCNHSYGSFFYQPSRKSRNVNRTKTTWKMSDNLERLTQKNVTSWRRYMSEFIKGVAEFT